MTTHAGMTGEAFERTVAEWIGSARHPRFAHPYTAMACQPMRGHLDYRGPTAFRTAFILPGGGADLWVPWPSASTGFPWEQVIGSEIGETGHAQIVRSVVLRDRSWPTTAVSYPDTTRNRVVCKYRQQRWTNPAGSARITPGRCCGMR